MTKSWSWRSIINTFQKFNVKVDKEFVPLESVKEIGQFAEARLIEQGSHEN